MKNDGGAAFACASEKGHQEGMSLRDYFAAKAIPKLISRGGGKREKEFVIPPTDIAKMAYEIADAMLAEREKGSQ